MIIWIFFFDFSSSVIDDVLPPPKAEKLSIIHARLQTRTEPTEDTLEQLVDPDVWGTLQ
jgi:hypothetical protein